MTNNIVVNTFKALAAMPKEKAERFEASCHNAVCHDRATVLDEGDLFYCKTICFHLPDSYPIDEAVADLREMGVPKNCIKAVPR